MVRRQGPILRTAGAATITFFALAALRFDDLTLSPTPALALWFLAGLVYTNLFEYWVHRFPMHRGLPLLRGVRRNHIEHHRVFHGENFRTRNPEDLAHISGRCWIFPLLLAGHYALATFLLPIDAAMAFLSACFLHYQAFELTHWLTHLEDNVVDRVLSRIPVVARIRDYQIEHHRTHHQTPIVAFNFNPPYLGDGLVPAPTARPVGALAPPPLLARRRAPTRPLVLYGTALVLGVAALGIAVFAQVRPTPGGSVPRSRN
jgi:hypothetical protein